MEYFIFILLAIVFLRWMLSQEKISQQTRQVVDEEPLDADAWRQEGDFERFNPKSIAGKVELLYRDASGNTTKRQVLVKECDVANQNGYLIGFCEMRKAIRTFRIDRVAKAVDMETGEIIKSLPRWAESRYKETAAYAVDGLVEEASDGLKILFYIAKADGRFTKKEKAIFLDYCRSIGSSRPIELDDVDSICSGFSVPTKQVFRLLCAKLAQGSEDRRIALLHAAEGMVATEKTVSAEELEALRFLRSCLSMSAVSKVDRVS